MDMNSKDITWPELLGIVNEKLESLKHKMDEREELIAHYKDKRLFLDSYYFICAQNRLKLDNLNDLEEVDKIKNRIESFFTINKHKWPKNSFSPMINKYEEQHRRKKEKNKEIYELRDALELAREDFKCNNAAYKKIIEIVEERLGEITEND